MIDLEQYKAQLARMRADAIGVADLYIERMQAYADERRAAGELLRWALQEVEPALPVLAGEIRPWPERGIWVSNDAHGNRLVLFMAPGAGAALSFAKISPAEPEAVRAWLTIDEVVQQWPVARLLRRLHERLQEELEGSAVERRDEALARTRKLRAVLELVT